MTNCQIKTPISATGMGYSYGPISRGSDHLDEIDAEIKALEVEIQDLLRQVTQ